MRGKATHDANTVDALELLALGHPLLDELIQTLTSALFCTFKAEPEANRGLEALCLMRPERVQPAQDRPLVVRRPRPYSFPSFSTSVTASSPLPPIPVPSHNGRSHLAHRPYLSLTDKAQRQKWNSWAVRRSVHRRTRSFFGSSPNFPRMAGGRSKR